MGLLAIVLNVVAAFILCVIVTSDIANEHFVQIITIKFFLKCLSLFVYLVVLSIR